jgi:MFS family permease
MGIDDARLPRLPISALGLLTIVTYGACYYAYGVLIQPIGAEMHWPPAALGAIFSAVLLITGVGGILAGGLLDRVGEQPLFLLAATVGAGAMLVASFQTGLVPFAIAYAGGCGLVGALGFYHITQSVAARTAPAEPARAIIWLTLIGALAGPIYLPLTGWLVEAAGWRDAIRLDAATVVVAFLLAAILVRGRGGPRRPQPHESAARALVQAWHQPVTRAWLLATLISGAAVDALLVYQIPAMVKLGLPLGIAATVAGFRGLSQLAGRLPLGPLIARLGTARPSIHSRSSASTALAVPSASTFPGRYCTSQVMLQYGGYVTVQTPPLITVGTMSPGARHQCRLSARPRHSARRASIAPSTIAAFSIAFTAPPSRQCGCGISAWPARPSTVISGITVPRQQTQASKAVGSPQMPASARTPCSTQARLPAPDDSSSVFAQ